MTPDSMQVKAGIVVGEVTEMKVIERVEEGTGRVAAPAKLTGKLSLKNTSSDQTMRLVGGKIRYIDMHGKPIALRWRTSAPSRRSSLAARATARPTGWIRTGVDPLPWTPSFPPRHLKAKNLKEVRLELAFIPSQFREEILNFAVSIGGQ